MQLIFEVKKPNRRIRCTVEECAKVDGITEKMMKFQQIEGLLDYKKEGSFLYYDCERLVSVSEYLTEERKKEQILKLILNIADTAEGIRKYMIPADRLVLETNWVFLDPEDEWVYLVCVPYENIARKGSLEQLYQGIVCQAIPEKEKTAHYLERLKDWTKDGKPYDYQVVSAVVKECSAMMEEDVKQEDLTREELPETDYGTVVWNNVRGMLTRTRNAQQFMLDKLEMTIGKDYQNVALYIADNPTISRSHAVIRNLNNQYVISDLKSTNHTYVNGMLLAPGDEVTLKNGDIVRLSNEEFLFQLV